MSITLTPEAKNIITLTGEEKANPTWDEATGTWDSAVGTWDNPGIILTPESKTYIGQELVTNGTFSGSSTGWTLGDGWTYSSNSLLYTLLGSDVVTNGTFTGNANGWTLGSRWTYNSNNIHMSTSSSSSDLSQDLTGLVTVGKTYQIDFNNTDTMGGLTYALGSNPAGSNGPHLSGTSQSAVLTCGSTHNLLIFRATASSPAGQTAGDLDNIVLRQYNTGTSSQPLAVTVGLGYFVTVTTTGTTGSITASFGGTTLTIAAGATTTGQITASTTTLTLTPSTDFNGTITRVSVVNGAFEAKN